jgi:phosphoserine phosphatase
MERRITLDGESRHRLAFTLLTALLVFSTACGAPQPASEVAQPAADGLASWSDGAAKAAIVEFVRQVTDPASPDFVPEAERIAVFDNDGTLWAEQPLYFQLQFAFDRVKALAEDHPEWQSESPFQAILEGDREALSTLTEHDLLEIMMSTHAGMTVAEFRQIAADWLATARHPRFDRPFTECAYQPMLEVLGYLRAGGFKTFIVSGGGIDFMRVFSEQVYGIPPDQVVGSSLEIQFELRDGKPVLMRLPEMGFIDDKAGKPVGIHQHIGRRPIAAFGNSDGDLQMLQYTAAGEGPRLVVLVHHDDDAREWAYDRESSIGRLDKGLDEAAENGWTVVSMNNDWRRVFAFEN